MLSEVFSIRPQPDTASTNRAERRKKDREVKKVERRTNNGKTKNQKDTPQDNSAGISRYA